MKRIAFFKLKLTVVVSVLTLVGAACSPFIAQTAHAVNNSKPPPKLILQITVDGLRGDMPMVHRSQFGKGGFKYLTDQGFHFVNAHFNYAMTETAPGHASLFSGTYPAHHGIVANDWVNPETNEVLYCVGDKNAKILGLPKASGRSPRNLIGTTIGDELIMASPKSRVFAASFKDRGAILPAGHLGKAFWYSYSNGEFITSDFYYKDYPKWVKNWNAQKMSDSYRNKQWELIQPINRYMHKVDVYDFEHGWKHLHNRMPKKYFPNKNIADGNFYGGLMLSPPGDEILLSFAKAMIENEKLGEGEATDFLSVSFSAIDYVMHYWGPKSLETNDTLVRLDRILADFIKYVDQKVGLDKTLIIFSGDHGSGMANYYMKHLGFTTERLHPDKILPNLNKAMRKRFNVDVDLIKVYYAPYIFLDEKTIKAKGLDLATVEQFVAEEALKFPIFIYAVTKSQMQSNNYPKTFMHQHILNNFHPKRSGNVYLLPEQFHMWYHKKYAGLTANHPYPRTHNTYVPIIFAGNGIGPQKSARLVSPLDIASTIAYWMDIKPTSGNTGKPLVEVLDAYRFK